MRRRIVIVLSIALIVLTIGGAGLARRHERAQETAKRQAQEEDAWARAYEARPGAR